MTTRQDAGHPARPWLALVVIAALVVEACGVTSPTPTPNLVSPSAASPSVPAGSATPAPTPTEPPAQVYAAIEAQVEQIRQLQEKRPVDPKILDAAALKKLVETFFREDNPLALVQANEDLLKHLGLLPPDASLEALYVQLLSSQVSGLYRPTTKELYVVSRAGALGPIEKTTFAHEFTHALQDQNFGIQKLGVDTIGEGDRSLARLSLVEGDATLSMSYWTQQHLSAGETLQLLAASSDPQQLQVLASMPPILRETLLFPYQQGLQFVSGLQLTGGWDAVDKAFGSPPDSTEQILHPEAYRSREAPIKVALPTDLATRAGSSWKVALEDTLGEFELRIWLREVAKLPADQAAAAAQGWGGDRVALLDGPDGRWGVVLATEWDTPADASEFRAGVEAMRSSASLSVPPAVYSKTGGTRVEVVLASDVNSQAVLSAALGHIAD